MVDGIKKRYILLNIIVILITSILFVYEYRNINALLLDMNLTRIFIIAVTVLLVHTIKAGRLYLALYDSELKLSKYLKVYCKVTPVSVVLPYKTGEFFRMYCYGKILDNMLRGVVIVLLDRFMDTIALVTMILLVWIFNGGHITAFTYVLIIFLILAMMIYYVFPGMYRFWKKYFISAKATEKKLVVLRMLEALNRVYTEVKGVSRGRGIILFFMSFTAWGIEIGSAAIQAGLLSNGNLSEIVSEYLFAAMGRGQCIELKQFVFMSVIMMLAIYGIIKFGKCFQGKKDYE